MWTCRFFFLKSCFLHVFLFYLRNQIIFFWWLRHGQIFPLKHRSDDRGYICIVNYMLFLSVHTTCHRKYQAKVAVTACVLRFPPTQLQRKTTLPFPYDLSSLQEVLHTICTQCVVPLLVLVTLFTPKLQMVGFLD